VNDVDSIVGEELVEAAVRGLNAELVCAARCSIS
jgi:hypothetical protein